MKRRLRAMGLRELACRGQQTVLKRWERLTAVREARSTCEGPAHREMFEETVATSFFLGAARDESARLIRHACLHDAAAIVASADRATRGIFDLLGYEGLSFGNPIDWHLEPVARRRIPLQHWTLLDPLDFQTVGDSKVVWELNRHQWMTRLGAAFRLTGDEKYASFFAETIGDWLRMNPPGFGINWTSSLEIALRVVSWCWALVLFLPSPAISPALFAQIRWSIAAHAAHIERYLSYYFSPNTHLTGEALGLLYAAVLFPDLRGAARWRRRALHILTVESRRQIFSDGVYFEQSTWYQRYTVDIYLHFLLLAERLGTRVPSFVSDLTQRMVDFLMAVRRPDGTMPEIGDADGGRLLPLTPKRPDDCRELFSTAAVVFERSDFAWSASALAPETVWLLGAGAKKTFEALRPSPPKGSLSRAFSEGGYVVMRSGRDAGARHLIFDVGPLGGAHSAGHGHADLLSVHCSAFADSYLIDSGTFCYTAGPEWRTFFRSTRAHSALVIDGRDQVNPGGPFAWEAKPAASLTRWSSNDVFDFAEAYHTAFATSEELIAHRRRVLFVKPHYWAIVDEVDGHADHLVELFFQFGPVPVALGPNQIAVARGAHGTLVVQPFARDVLKGHISIGEETPIAGWISNGYGLKVPAPRLTYSCVGRAPLRLMTILLPRAASDREAPDVDVLESDDLGPLGLALDGGRGTLVLTTRDVVINGQHHAL